MQKWKRYDQNTRIAILSTLKTSALNQHKVGVLLMQKEFEDFTKDDWKLLKEVGIVNGVGPGYILNLWKGFRIISGIIFFAVDYRRHDVNYFVGGYESDRKIADDGLLKYSLLSFHELLKKFHFSSEINATKRLGKILKIAIDLFLIILYTTIGSSYFVVMFLLIIFVILAYYFVRAYGGKGSFNYVDNFIS